MSVCVCFRSYKPAVFKTKVCSHPLSKVYLHHSCQSGLFFPWKEIVLVSLICWSLISHVPNSWVLTPRGGKCSNVCPWTHVGTNLLDYKTTIYPEMPCWFLFRPTWLMHHVTLIHLTIIFDHSFYSHNLCQVFDTNVGVLRNTRWTRNVFTICWLILDFAPDLEVDIVTRKRFTC